MKITLTQEECLKFATHYVNEQIYSSGASVDVTVEPAPAPHIYIDPLTSLNIVLGVFSSPSIAPNEYKVNEYKVKATLTLRDFHKTNNSSIGLAEAKQFVEAIMKLKGMAC